MVLRSVRHTQAAAQPQVGAHAYVCSTPHLQRSLAKLTQAWKCCSLLVGQNLLLLSLTCAQAQCATTPSTAAAPAA